MNLREAMATVPEACPDPVCAHDVAFMGRKACTFNRSALLVILTALAKEHTRGLERGSKLSEHIYAPGAVRN